jgi:peptide deformylase
LKPEAGAESPATASLPVLEAPDPRLRVLSTPVKTIDDGLRPPIADVFEQLYDAPGIGPAI